MMKHGHENRIVVMGANGRGWLSKLFHKAVQMQFFKL